MPVLFASTRPYKRAENIRAVYQTYIGEKDFICLEGDSRRHPLLRSGKYPVIVMDEYPSEANGKVILLWHAIYGGKTAGFAQPNTYITKRDSKLITYAVSSSTAMVDTVAHDFGLPNEKVIPLGMPRTDWYVGRRKGDGHTELAHKRSYLYLPTFRNQDETPIPQIDWKWLDAHLTDDELLVVKHHMRTGRMLKWKYRHIIEVDPMKPSSEYLYDCDVIVTDYSSVIFDGYLLGKPSVLFEKDQGYMSTRGMTLDYPAEYSSRYATNEYELLGMLRSADGLGEIEKRCMRKVADRCDGHASLRVCSLIHELIG